MQESHSPVCSSLFPCDRDEWAQIILLMNSGIQGQHISSVLSALTHQAFWLWAKEQDTLSPDGLTKRAFITPKKFIQPAGSYPQASQHIWKDTSEFQLTKRGWWWVGESLCDAHRMWEGTTHCVSAWDNRERSLTISTSYNLFFLELDIRKVMSKNGQNEQKNDSFNLFFNYKYVLNNMKS